MRRDDSVNVGNDDNYRTVRGSAGCQFQLGHESSYFALTEGELASGATAQGSVIRGVLLTDSAWYAVTTDLLQSFQTNPASPASKTREPHYLPGKSLFMQ